MKSSIMSNIPGESAPDSWQIGSLSRKNGENGDRINIFEGESAINLQEYGSLSRLLRLISERSGMPGAGNFAMS